MRFSPRRSYQHSIPSLWRWSFSAVTTNNFSFASMGDDLLSYAFCYFELLSTSLVMDETIKKKKKVPLLEARVFKLRPWQLDVSLGMKWPMLLGPVNGRQQSAPSANLRKHIRTLITEAIYSSHLGLEHSAVNKWQYLLTIMIYHDFGWESIIKERNIVWSLFP